MPPAHILLPRHSRRAWMRAATAMGLAAGLPGIARALAPQPGRETRELRVITGPDPGPMRGFLQALKARYPNLIMDSDPAALDARHGPGLYVALGQAALRRAWSADLKGPLVSVFTSSQIYRQISAAAPHGNATAIFAEAPPAAQLQLIGALFERRINVAVLLSEASSYLEKPLRQAAAQTGLDLEIERAEPGPDVVRALARLTSPQVLLAVPDSTLYTPDTLRAVLESTYRRGLPVVGFSSATVAAGTLATAYCAIDDVLADLADLTDPLLASAGAVAMPEPRFPRFWRVAFNENVARSLGVAITDKVRRLGNPASGGTP